MSSKSKTYGNVYFVYGDSGVVRHLTIPARPTIAALERAMRSDFDAVAAAGGSSVRLQFTETLDDALADGGPDLDRVIAASALGLLRLHNRQNLAVVDRENHYKYMPVEYDEDALKSLQIYGHPWAPPVTSKRLH